MKKRIYSIIAVAIAVTVWHSMPAFAAKIDVGGELRARGYYIQSNSFIKDNDHNWLDARFRLDTKVQQGMTTAVVQADLLANHSTVGTADNGNLVFGNSTGSSYDLVGIRQAYLAINFPNATLIGGRYEVKLGNGLVLNDTSDLLAIAAPVGPVNLLVGYLVLGEDDSAAPGITNPPASSGDDTAFAVNAGIKNLGGSGWDTNLFVVSAHLQSVDPDNKLQVFGLTGNGKIGPTNVAAEVDLFSGDATSSASFKGTNFLLSGNMPVGPVGVTAALLYASGKDSTSTSSDVNINTIDGDFRASNILVRDDFNNYEGVSSLSIGAASLGPYLINGLGLQAIKVAATLPSHKMLHATHTPEIGLVWAQTSEDDVDGDSDIGTELYVNTNCVFDQNLSGNIGLAFVSAGDAMAAAPTKAEDQLKAEFSLTFHF